VNEQQIQQRIDDAVTKAVAQVSTQLEAKQQAKVNELLAATEEKMKVERATLAALGDENILLRKQNNTLLVRTAGLTKDGMVTQ
jgi:hypothetical protein